MTDRGSFQHAWPATVLKGDEAILRDEYAEVMSSDDVVAQFT